MGRNITLYISAVDEAKIALLREYLKQHYTMSAENMSDEQVVMAAFDVQCLNTIGVVEVQIVPTVSEMEA